VLKVLNNVSLDFAPAAINIYSRFRGECCYHFEFLDASLTGKNNVLAIDIFLTNHQARISSEALKQTCHATKV